MVRPYDFPPLGMMYLSSILKESGYHVEVVTAQYNQLKKRLLKEEDLSKVILAYSVMTFEAEYFLRLNRRIKKEFKVFSVFGGSHPTFFPEMIEEDGVDAVCIGEGEYSLPDLVDRLKRGKEIRTTKNYWVKQEGVIYKNPLNELVSDLDEIPFPDRDLFRSTSFQHTIMASRGCLFNCSYCFNHAYNKLYDNCPKEVRIRSIGNIIKELFEMKRNNLLKNSWVSFIDSNFISDTEWLKEFAYQYKNKINIPFTVNVHPNLVTDKGLDYLKKADCFLIRLGIESGSFEVRKNILKRPVTDEQIIKACRMIKERGFLLRTYNMLGIPGSTIDDDYKTIELNIRCKPTATVPQMMCPYPKTEMYVAAQKLGLLSNNFSFGSKNPSTLRFSQVKFNNKKDKLMIENLHKLSPLVINFPGLLPLTKLLIRLPNNLVFYLIFYFFSLYVDNIKLTPSRSHIFSIKAMRNLGKGIKKTIYLCRTE